jgi:hypothetical protein
MLYENKDEQKQFSKFLLKELNESNKIKRSKDQNQKQKL